MQFSHIDVNLMNWIGIIFFNRIWRKKFVQFYMIESSPSCGMKNTEIILLDSLIVK
jgi:uncharacterized protein YbbK (DUF523 family)